MANTVNNYFSWASDPAADVTQPSPSLMAAGYTAGQRPTAGNINAIFQTLGAQLRQLAEGGYATASSSALEPNIRLMGGGQWSWNASIGLLSWSDTITLSVPGLPDSQNTIPAGSVTLSQGQSGYIPTANLPFQVQGDTVGGSYSVGDLSFTDGIVVGMSVAGGSVPQGAVVTELSGDTATLSQAPTQSASQVTLTFVNSGALLVTAAATQSISAGPATVVLARRYDTDVAVCIVGVGSGQMVLRDGEQKTLLGEGYTATQRLTAATAITQGQALYANVSTGQVAPASAAAGAASNQTAFIGFAQSAAAQGAYAHVVSAGELSGLSGLVPSSVYYVDPANIGGITNGKPSGSGQSIIPVGVALSTTTLLINPAAAALASLVNANLEVKGNLQVDGTSTFGGAIQGATVNGTGQPITVYASLTSPSSYGSSINFSYFVGQQATLSGLVSGGSFQSSAGFLRAIWLGGYQTTNFPGGTQPTTATYSGSDDQRRVTLAYSGSIKSLSVSFKSSTSAITAITVYKNGSSFFSVNMNQNANKTGGYATFPKGEYAFAQGDVLAAGINFSSTGVSASAQVEMTIESDA